MGHIEISNITFRCVILHNVIIQDEANCNSRSRYASITLGVRDLVINPLTPSHLRLKPTYHKKQCENLKFPFTPMISQCLLMVKLNVKS
jgi:hypothetical protein